MTFQITFCAIGQGENWECTHTAKIIVIFVPYKIRKKEIFQATMRIKAPIQYYLITILMYWYSKMYM
jgi:hypothetical protein